MDKFNFKIGHIELRSCDVHLLGTDDHVTAEIVQWLESGSCITAAYWIRDDEGYGLKFVGDRPFETNKNAFWQLASVGQEILTDYFNEEDED